MGFDLSKNSEFERKYRNTLNVSKQLNVDDFMQNNYTRAANTRPTNVEKCLYGIAELIRDTAASDDEFRVASVPSAGDSEKRRKTIEPHPVERYSLLYQKIDESGMSIMSVGNLYISDSGGSCDIPIVTMPRRAGDLHGGHKLKVIKDPNTGEETLGPDGFSIYSAISKRYYNRPARIWLAIWPHEEGKYKDKDGNLIRVLGPYENFFLVAINESRSERYQINVPTSSEFPEIVYFFGRNPLMISASFRLLNSVTHNWKEEFIQLYETTFRGTQLVKNKTSIYIEFEDVLITAYLLNLNVSESVGSDSAVTVSMQMLATRRATMAMPYMLQNKLGYDPSLASTAFADGDEYYKALHQSPAATTTELDQQSNGANIRYENSQK